MNSGLVGALGAAPLQTVKSRLGSFQGRSYTHIPNSGRLMIGSSTVGPILEASSNKANASIKLSSNGNHAAAGGSVILEGGSNIFGGNILQVNRKGDAAGAAFTITNGNEAFFGNGVYITQNLSLHTHSVQTDYGFFKFGSNQHLTWTAHPNSNINKDTGLQRVAAGVLKITDSSTGGGVLEMPQVATGGAASANSARLYSKDVSGTAEMFVMNESGNETQLTGTLIPSGTLRLKGYTVGTLPAGAAGDTAYVTDALTPVSLADVVGGGAVVVTVFHNGTTWTVQ